MGDTLRMAPVTCDLPTPPRELIEWAAAFAQEAYRLRFSQALLPSCRLCGAALLRSWACCDICGAPTLAEIDRRLATLRDGIERDEARRAAGLPAVAAMGEDEIPW